MRVLFICLTIINLLFGGVFTKDKLNLIYMSDNNKIYDRLVDITIKNLKDDYDINFKKQFSYQALLATINNPDYYKDNKKLVTGLVADSIFDRDGYYVVFHIKDEDNKIILNGVKFLKDGVNGKAQRFYFVKSYKTKKEKIDYILNMLYFSVKSDILTSHPQNRKGVKPIISKEGNNLEVIFFKQKEVGVFNDVVAEKDIKLAKILGLIKGELDSEVAYNYCNFMNMLLPNQNFINKDDEYSFEDYFIQTSFVDGYKIFKKFYPKEEKNFRCMDNAYTLNKEPLEDYELNELGLVFKLNNNKFNVAGGIYEDKNNLKIVLVDNNGYVSLWQNDNKTKDFYIDTPVKGIEDILVDSYGFDIIAFNKRVKYDLDGYFITSKSIYNHFLDNKYYFKISLNNKINIYNELLINNKKMELDFKVLTFYDESSLLYVGGENGKLISIFKNGKIKTQYQGLKGDIVKIISIKYNFKRYLGVITSKGEFVIYDKNKNKPLISFPQIGYGYNNIKDTQKHILLINSNYTSYVLMKKVLFKGQK